MKIFSAFVGWIISVIFLAIGLLICLGWKSELGFYNLINTPTWFAVGFLVLGVGLNPFVMRRRHKALKNGWAYSGTLAVLLGVLFAGSSLIGLEITKPFYTGEHGMNEPNRALSVAYSPDGTRIAAGLNNGHVRIWNAATGAVIADTPPLLKGEQQNINGGAPTASSIAFFPDGKRLIVGQSWGTNFDAKVNFKPMRILDGTTG